MDLAVYVVQIKRQTDVFFAFPILAYFIIFFEDLQEVVGVLLSQILYSEVIYYQCETYGAP